MKKCVALKKARTNPSTTHHHQLCYHGRPKPWAYSNRSSSPTPRAWHLFSTHSHTLAAAAGQEEGRRQSIFGITHLRRKKVLQRTSHHLGEEWWLPNEKNKKCIKLKLWLDYSHTPFVSSRKWFPLEDQVAVFYTLLMKWSTCTVCDRTLYTIRECKKEA